MQSEPARIRVPLKACPIVTPLNLSVWRQVLLSYPDGSLANFFLQGMAQGFRVGYRTLSTHLSTARQNMCSALAHPEVVEEYLAKERRDGRVLGPFPLEISPPVHVSRFGVIPKSGKPNKWRLIIDLSHPQQRSVNDDIPKALYSMTYVRVDDAINQLVASGPGSLMAKIDIRNAFRLIPQIGINFASHAMEGSSFCGFLSTLQAAFSTQAIQYFG